MENTIEIGKSWTDGQTVRGQYCGQKYRGKLDSSNSRLTPDGSRFIFAVTLDQPINVYGQPRERIEVWQ